MRGSQQPEQLFCSTGDCLEPAVAHGQVTLEVGAQAGAAPDDARQTFSLPLCKHHAHLLGSGTTLVSVSSGLPRAGDGRRAPAGPDGVP